MGCSPTDLDKCFTCGGYLPHNLDELRKCIKAETSKRKRNRKSKPDWRQPS